MWVRAIATENQLVRFLLWICQSLLYIQSVSIDPIESFKLYRRVLKKSTLPLTRRKTKCAAQKEGFPAWGNYNKTEAADGHIGRGRDWPPWPFSYGTDAAAVKQLWWADKCW